MNNKIMDKKVRIMFYIQLSVFGWIIGLFVWKFIIYTIQETLPDNKVQHSFYKLHIVRDHEQRQSEMTDHNKDKPYPQYDYWDLFGLMP